MISSIYKYYHDLVYNDAFINKPKPTLFYCKEFYEYMIEIFNVDYVFSNNDYKILSRYFTTNKKGRIVPKKIINEVYDMFGNKEFYELWKEFKKLEVTYAYSFISEEDVELYYDNEILYYAIYTYVEELVDKSEINKKENKKSKFEKIETNKYDLINILYSNMSPFPLNCVGIYALEKIYYTYSSNVKSIDGFVDDILNEKDFNVKEHEIKWNRKYQAKYMMKLSGKYKTFIIDVMFLDDYSYLALVNVNTRKMYCECLNLFITDQGYKLKSPRSYTSGDIIKSMNKIINKTDIRHIYCDQDGKFNSDIFIEYCRRRNISIKYAHMNKYRGNDYHMHGLLSIVDRNVRTIRKYLYNAGNPDPNPVVIDQLVEYYNNKPHKGLKSILRMEVTPNQVDNDIRLEKELVKRIQKNNVIIRISTDFILEPGTKVKVYKPIENGFEKRPSQLFPGIWTVQGYDEGLIIVTYKGHEFRVPRWHLVKI